ncbi:MAG: fructose-2 6-bisphosphatase-like protein [uncultured bacterium]|nr:MAG: fructose-2 6-bisphosphatase-like protein [uncultured bacterium]
MNKFIIKSDGGARGNPGSGAYGFVIKPEENSKFKFVIFNPSRLKGDAVADQIQNSNVQIKDNIVYGSGYLGVTTNNQAEYHGILNALKYLLLHVTCYMLHDFQIECFLDSQLIVEQMNGRYKIKNEGLKPLYWEIRGLIMDLGGKVTFAHIPRAQNAEADKLVNEAIDNSINIS